MRPTKYKKEFAEQAYKLCLLGATDAELADFFGVQEKTVNNWKKAHKEFLQSIKRGKDIADADVAERLYMRAMGYMAKDTKFATHEGLITDEREHSKEYPPDTTAAIFWLKNRQSAKWRDKQEVDHGASDSLTILLQSFDGKETGLPDANS